MATVRSGRLILAAIMAIFVYGVIAAMLGTLMPTFKLTPEENGNIALAQALGLVIASVSAGPLIDNKGKKVALVIGLGLIAVALYALPNAAGYGQIMGFLFLLGFGGGIIVTAANALVSDINEQRRASTLNFLNLFFGLGGMATPLVAANVLNNDARMLCYLSAILATATFLVHITTAIPPPSGERGFKVSEAGGLLARPVLYLLALFMFLYVAAEVGVWNWLASFLESQGIDPSTAKNIVGWGFAFGLLVGRVVVSRILIKVAAPTVTLFAAMLMAVSTYLMLNATGSLMAGAAVFLAGLAMAPVFPTTLAMVGDAFPKATATAMGIVITCGWLGLAVSSPLIGAIGGKDPAQLQTALLVLPAFSVAMVIVNLALRPLLRKSVR
jgi:fucose permease